MAIRDLIPWGRDNRPAPVPSKGEEHPFLTLHREMNRLFDDVFGRSFLPSAASFGGLANAWPRVEVVADDKGLKVTAELPGLEEKDVDLRLEKDGLLIAGETNSERQDATRGYSERYHGRFERWIPLPFEVDEDSVEATFRNGVLDVTLPKSPKARESGKRIQIGGASGVKH